MNYVLLLGTLTLLACGNKPECDGTTYDEFITEYADTHCAWRAACEDTGIWSYGPEEECRDFLTTIFASQADQFDACRAQDCLDAMNAIPECGDDRMQWSAMTECYGSTVMPPATP